ncbi:MAG: thermonuclease family protein [Rhodospirillales bacterium]
MVLAMAAGFTFSDVAGGESYAISGPIPARVIEVIDGDTVIVRAKIWLGQEVETRVRLAGVDTPEIKGKCENERRLARDARDLVRQMLGREGEVVLSDIHYGKYAGRVVARVDTPDGEDFSGALIRAGLGGRYDGGPRLNWCE